MNKTPISILQEMMVKKCMVPNYELIHNGGGTHINTFTYQVSCDGLSATGTGRCKKDAKHEAAKAMLETIASVQALPQLPASPAQSPIHTPLPNQIPPTIKTPANVPFVNAIGALQEVCSENNLQEPVYQSISDVGPPHARVFTIHCIVSTFKEEGIATTKKQAKHEAAKKMLHRITNVLADQGVIENLRLKVEDVSDLARIAEDKYPELTKLPVVKKTNYGIKISEYHLKLKESLDTEERINIIDQVNNLIDRAKTEINDMNLDTGYNKIAADFQNILANLNIELKEISVTAKTGEGTIIGITLDSSPPITELSHGVTKDEAKVKALMKIMKSFARMIA